MTINNKMETIKRVNRAVELVDAMAPMLAELNEVLLELDYLNLDIDSKERLDNLYRNLNDAEYLYSIKETLENAEIVDYDDDEYEEQEDFDLEQDPNDWDDEALQPEYRYKEPEEEPEEVCWGEDDELSLLEQLDDYKEKSMDYGQRVFLATDKVEGIIDYIECNNKDLNKINKQLKELLEILKTEQRFAY